MITVGLDLDGCLVDFNKGFADLCSLFWGVEHFYPKDWDLSISSGLPPDKVEVLWSFIKQTNYFEYLPVVPKNLRAVGELSCILNSRKDVQAVVITTRPECAEHSLAHPILQQSCNWLFRHSVPVEQVIVTSHKGRAAAKLNMDVYYEDNYEFARMIKLASPSTTVFVQAEPYNEKYLHKADDDGLVVVDGLIEMVTWLRTKL